MVDIEAEPVCAEYIGELVQEQLVHPCENITLAVLPRSLPV